MTIKTLLVANRGEIACRIFRTARELGIRTVAVHTPVDAGALFARLADARVPVDSYLKIDSILDAARAAGADAIHPGYGFLSENAAFADACAKAGIVFVGPPASAMRKLGDKQGGKALAEAAGVPTIPGAVESGVPLEKAAEVIGFPLLIKASAGGGGRGMRLASSPKEFPEAMAAARREAKGAFGDDRLILEKYIRPARHIEIQFLADVQGHCVYLGERECSIQRRHQKILEESPSPLVDEPLRRAMGEAAVRLAKAAGYVNAGTAEFLVDAQRNFYFLEVNARLQVEHPVTEGVYGVDLVRLQLEIASGAPLALRQEDLRPRGHAIEARICAEDPAREFLPSAGPILHLEEPRGPGVRVDSGVEAGGEVPVDYDSLLSKLIVHAPDRRQAAARLERALWEYVLLGVPTNIPFLIEVVHHPAFRDGILSTDFLRDHFPSWTPPVPELPELFAAAWEAFESRGQAAPGMPPNGGSAAAGGPSGRDPYSPWQSLGEWGRT